MRSRRIVPIERRIDECLPSVIASIFSRIGHDLSPRNSGRGFALGVEASRQSHVAATLCASNLAHKHATARLRGLWDEPVFRNDA